MTLDLIFRLPVFKTGSISSLPNDLIQITEILQASASAFMNWIKKTKNKKQKTVPIFKNSAEV